jgi:hypothetical protein
MRGRTAALAGAGVLLLAGLVAMRSMLSTDDTLPPPAPAATPPAAAAAPPEVAAPAAPVAPAPPVPAPVVVHTGPAAISAESTPALPPVVQAFVPAEKKPPIANKKLLREQVAAVAAQVADCAKQTSFTGSGSAVLTYLVAPDKQKQAVAIETTGVEYDGTTIDDQPLLDCLKDTAKAMTFAYVPDTDGVFAFRRVTFQRGKLVENTFVNFHYVR